MKIKICDSNEDKINKSLEATNGRRATTWTIHKYFDVSEYAKMIEKELESSQLAKSERVGTIAIITPSGPGAKSYMYNARSTGITIKRGSKDWFLTDVEECWLFPKQSERVRLMISQQQSEIIQQKAIKKYTVHKEQAA